MPNNNLPRLHLKTHIEAPELRLKPNEWPNVVVHNGNVFKRNLCKRFSVGSEIKWYDYHCNTKEHFWVLKVWNV